MAIEAYEECVPVSLAFSFFTVIEPPPTRLLDAPPPELFDFIISIPLIAFDDLYPTCRARNNDGADSICTSIYRAHVYSKDIPCKCMNRDEESIFIL